MPALVVIPIHNPRELPARARFREYPGRLVEGNKVVVDGLTDEQAAERFERLTGQPPGVVYRYECPPMVRLFIGLEAPHA